jgi:hypothetical protein
MGGKSRKAGRVSQALVQRLKSLNPPKDSTVKETKKVPKKGSGK